MTDTTTRPADQELTPEALKVIETVRKLLNLANKNPNPEEAASAAAKAQKMLAEHNIQMSMVEEQTGKVEGKREKAKLQGGMYKYQQALWTAVAELNFCLYWNQQTWEKRKVQQRYTGWGQGFWNEKLGRYTQYQWVEDYARTWRHTLVGRTINTQSTVVLAQYLEGAIERLLLERLSERTDQPNSQRFSSWAVAYREGAVYDLVERLEEKRRGLIDEMERAAREAELRARESGVSLATSLSIEVMAQTERDANMDHIYGEGWSAQQRAKRAEAARIKAEEEAAYAQWAAANPEEARKEEAKRREEARKYWARRRGGGGGSHTETASDKNPGAFAAGRRDAAKISIDTQVGAGDATQKRLS